jgi:hypothetical protein
MSNPTNSVLSTRVDQAAKIMKVDPKIVWERLAILGIDKDDESLILLESDMTQEGDARRIFVEVNGVERVGDVNPISVPIVRFKAGWAILKGKSAAAVSADGQSSDLKSILDAMKTPSQMSDKELLDRYNPNASSDICDELERRSHERPFIVFDESKGENSIDTEATLNLLRIARRQDTPSTYKVGNGKISRVHSVGEFPMVFIEECPIHSDVILAEDYCERCMESWAGISYDDRVIVRVAKDINAIDVSTIAKAYELIVRLRKEGAKFLLEIPALQLHYEELKTDNKLPVLRRRFSSSPNRMSDPFYIRR